MDSGVNLELYAYVKQALEGGASDTAIRQKLLGAGYNASDISNTILAARESLKREALPESQKSFTNWLKGYYVRSKLSIGSLIGIDMVLIVLSLLEPWPLKIVADSVFGDTPAPGILEPLTGTFELLVAVAAISVLLFIATSAVAVLDEYIATKLIYKFDVQIKGELFNHILRLPFYHKERLHKGDYINRLRTLTNDVGGLVLDSTSNIAESILTIVAVLLVLIFINPKLTAIGLIIVPLLYLSIRFFAPKIQKLTEEKQGVVGELANHIQESVENAETIQAFTDETNTVNKMLSLMKRKLTLDIKGVFLNRTFGFTNSLFVILGSTSILIIGGREILAGTLSFGELFIFINYMQRLYGPVEGVTHAIADIKRRMVSAHRVYDVVEDHQEIEDVTKGFRLEGIQGRVRFVDVSLAYDNEVVLHNVNLDIPPGRKVAFIGPSGGGKSTLLKMVPMFIPPTAGKIYIDDYDISQSSLDSIRSNISIVGQSPQLFSGSILENIMLGAKSQDISDEEIEHALYASNSEEFLVKLPSGFKTYVGESGSMLSGGQKQRIAIARGLLKKSPIMVMDEPTSALDAASENHIKENLREITGNATVLLITHKLAILEAMDDVYAVQGGSVKHVNEYGGLQAYLHHLQGNEIEA